MTIAGVASIVLAIHREHPGWTIGQVQDEAERRAKVETPAAADIARMVATHGMLVKVLRRAERQMRETAEFLESKRREWGNLEHADDLTCLVRDVQTAIKVAETGSI